MSSFQNARSKFQNFVKRLSPDKQNQTADQTTLLLSGSEEEEFFEPREINPADVSFKSHTSEDLEKEEMDLINEKLDQIIAGNATYRQADSVWKQNVEDNLQIKFHKVDTTIDGLITDFKNYQASEKMEHQKTREYVKDFEERLDAIENSVQNQNASSVARMQMQQEEQGTVESLQFTLANWKEEFGQLQHKVWQMESSKNALAAKGQSNSGQNQKKTLQQQTEAQHRALIRFRKEEEVEIEKCKRQMIFPEIRELLHGTDAQRKEYEASLIMGEINHVRALKKLKPIKREDIIDNWRLPDSQRAIRRCGAKFADAKLVEETVRAADATNNWRSVQRSRTRYQRFRNLVYTCWIKDINKEESDPSLEWVHYHDEGQIIPQLKIDGNHMPINKDIFKEFEEEIRNFFLIGKTDEIISIQARLSEPKDNLVFRRFFDHEKAKDFHKTILFHKTNFDPNSLALPKPLPFNAGVAPTKPPPAGAGSISGPPPQAPPPGAASVGAPGPSGSNKPN